ncbi:uncharacterized protein LOC113294964 [Papaver somniferum]|uniref:uncharacterized protein LOC113294964 n=1 Tax=Papaver somniferum TaxID=3469 RepID=UPI000E702325|nr:uncharacterized protein LOC113294964 [Papaver somniferum]
MVKLCFYKSDITPTCPLCDQEPETLDHLILDCASSRAIWFAMNINVANIQSSSNAVTSWIISWFSDPSITNQDYWNTWIIMVMITTWEIWKNRCNKVFRNKSPNITKSVKSINYQIQHCFQIMIHRQQQSTLNKSLQFTSTWEPPFIGQLKINIDVSYDDVDKEFGFGLIIRDYTGTCRGVRGRHCNGGLNAEHSERFGVLEAIKWVKDLNLSNLVFESDCINVVNSLKGATLDVQWENQGFVIEIRHLLNSFSNGSVNYVKRTANNVAQKPANKARTSRATFQHFEIIPADIVDLLRDA